ncbi:signal-transduction protein with cAMP-binding, CBS, and nucleotidyltransferase domain [Pedobacter sp. CAN_A7]|uniref:Crp/Fnr family transcriptional regulator n=1 Tax=Pedobacter sp. CAN_A7 TaxID=2787722 RepID=UPI0018C9AE8B
MEISELNFTTIFNVLDPAGQLMNTHKNKLISKMEVLTLSEKTHLLRPDKICKDIYFVLDGFIMYYEQTGKQKQHINFFQANEFIIGTPSLVTPGTTNAGLFCQNKAIVMHINFHAWMSICEEEPFITELMNTYNVKQVLKNLNRNRILMKGKIKNRLHTFNKEYPGVINFVSQKYLGDLMGVTEQAISKAKSRMS